MADEPRSWRAALQDRLRRERLPLAFGVMIALFYGVGMGAQGHVLPGLAGGLLGGLLAYLVMREAEGRQRRRQAERQGPAGGGPRDR
jgi:membrane associated rhomboid family serine protease